MNAERRRRLILKLVLHLRRLLNERVLSPRQRRTHNGPKWRGKRARNMRKIPRERLSAGGKNNI